MTGDESGRRTRPPDVLGSLPGAGPASDPAVLDEIWTGIADIRRKMDALAADGRARPAAEALEAAVEDAVRKIVEARPADAGAGEAAAIASRADGMDTPAARMEAGAARMEAAAERTENRLEADLERTAELLAGDPWEIGPKTTAIEERLDNLSETARKEVLWFKQAVASISRDLAGLESQKRDSFWLWTVSVFVLGLLIGEGMRLIYRWL